MLDPLIVLLSAIALFSLLMIKSPLIIWYSRFRRWIWHRWIIWKIERNLQKTSIETEKLLELIFE